MPDRVNLTRAAIERIALPSTVKRVDVLDSVVAGLRLQVTANGSRTWYFRGRVQGVQRMVRIGRWPDVTTEQARASARRIIGMVAEGIDPQAEKRRRAMSGLTMDDLFATWLEEHAKLRKRTWAADEKLWRNHCRGPLGSRRANELTPEEVRRWHARLGTKIEKPAKKAPAAATEADAGSGPDEVQVDVEAGAGVEVEVMAGAAPAGSTGGGRMTKDGKKPSKRTKRVERGPYIANRALALMRTVCNYAPARVWGPDGNPCRGVSMFPEQSRERFLNAAELRRLFEVLRLEPDHKVRDLVLLLLYTGARRRNVQSMRWDALDLEGDRVWTIPAEEAKGGQAMRIPLSEEAIEVLRLRWQEREQLKEEHRHRDSPWVFPAVRGEGPMKDSRDAWDRIRKAAGIEDVRLHDLRRTLGSWQAAAGASLPIIGRSLGHTSLQATQVYARLDLDPVRASIQAATKAMRRAEATRQSQGSNGTLANETSVGTPKEDPQQ